MRITSLQILFIKYNSVMCDDMSFSVFKPNYRVYTCKTCPCNSVVSSLERALDNLQHFQGITEALCVLPVVKQMVMYLELPPGKTALQSTRAARMPHMAVSLKESSATGKHLTCTTSVESACHIYSPRSIDNSDILWGHKHCLHSPLYPGLSLSFEAGITSMISPVTSENMAKAKFNLQQLSPITLTKLSCNRCYGLRPLMTALLPPCYHHHHFFQLFRLHHNCGNHFLH